MLNMTSIEEIVKYQQELLNHQRNQKLIQKETIKLLNALNKNITFMSDRLDEFALKTNIKLEVNNASSSSSASQNHPINVNTIQELNNVNSNDAFFNTNFYDTQLNANNSNTSMTMGGTVVPATSQPLSLNEDIKEYYILSDCNLEPLSVAHNSVGQHQVIQSGNQQMQSSNQLQQPQQLILIHQDPISNNMNIINSKPTSSSKISKIKASPSRLSSGRNGRSVKLSDTTNTNTTCANTTATSDESLDDDMSGMDESSEEEKETIQRGKKPKTSFSGAGQTSKTKEFDESHNQQRLFNKYVREHVENRLGKEFLLLHEIQEINHDVMESIKKDALEMYPPVNIRPRRAWHLAKASLRCRRRSLRRQKEKLTLSNSSLADSNLSTLGSNLQTTENNPHVQTMITMTNL